MANPVGFEGANVVFQAAPGTEDQVRDLETFTDGEQVVSCWRLSEEELRTINETGVVWLGVLGTMLPPMRVSGTALVTIGDRPARAEPYIPKKGRDNGA